MTLESRTAVAPSLRVPSLRAHLTTGPSGLLVGVAVGNVGNVLFHLVASRGLPAGDYGAMGALLGFLLVFSVPASALQVSLTAEASRHRAAGRAVSVNVLQGRFLRVGLALGCVVAAASSLIAPLLHLTSPWAVIWLAGWLVAATAGLVPRAVLLADEAFAKVVTTVLVSTTVKLLGGALLIAGGGVERAMFAVFVSEVVLFVLLHVLLGRSESNAWSLNLRQADSSLSMMAFTGLWLLVATDTALARYFLDDLAADTYAAAATITRLMLFVPQALAVGFFPQLVRAEAAAARRLVTKLVVIVGIGGIVGTGVIAASSKVLVPMLFGGDMTPSARLVVVLGLTSTAVGAVNLLVHYHLPRARPNALAGWGGLVVFCVLILSWNQTPEAIAQSLLVAVFVALVLARPAAIQTPVEPKLSDVTDISLGGTDLSFVVTYTSDYAHQLLNTMVECISMADELGRTVEIVVARSNSDLSSDDIDVVTSVRWPGVRFVPPGSRAREHALRSANGKVVVLYDADAEAENAIDTVLWMLDTLEAFQAEAVVGSRQSRGERTWRTDSSPSDLLLMFRRLVVHPQLPDDRSPVKVFEQRALQAALDTVGSSGGELDFEVMAALRLRRSLVVEIPYGGRRPSRPVTTTSVVSALADAFRVSIRTHVRTFSLRQTSDVGDRALSQQAVV